MKKINVIAMVVLCNCGYISTMQRLLEQSPQTKNNNGIFMKEDASSFYADKSKKTVTDFNKKRVYDPESFRVSGPAVTHGLPWRDIPKASFLLSMPVVTLMAGATAYEYGLAQGIGCSFAVALGYVAILKKILN